MKILNKILSIILLLEFMLSVTIVIFLMFIFRSKNRIIRKHWANSQLKLLIKNLQVQGELDSSAQMFILNHQSMLDIVLLEKLHPGNPCWIAKQEIAKLFFFGLVLKLPKMIAIDRKNPREIVRIISAVKERIKENRVIMIFPEGTRSNGDKLLKFQVGAQIISNKLNLKVQPVVIIGSKKVMDSKNLDTKPGNVKVVFLPSFQASGEWLENARKDMQNTLEENLKDF